MQRVTQYVHLALALKTVLGQERSVRQLLGVQVPDVLDSLLNFWVPVEHFTQLVASQYSYRNLLLSLGQSQITRFTEATGLDRWLHV